MTLTERINDLFARFNVKLEATEVEVQLEAQAVLENGTIIYTDADDFAEGADVFIINEEGERIPLPQGDYTLQDGSKMSIAEGGKVSVAPNKGEGKDGAEGKDGGDGKAKPANPAKSKDVVKDDGDAPKAPAKPDSKPNPPKKGKKSEQEKLAEDTEEVVMEEEVFEVLEEEEKEEVLQEVFVTEEEVRALINQILDERMADNDEDSVEAEKKDEEEMEEEKEEMQTEVSEDQQELSEVEKLKAEITELKSQAASEGVKRVVKTEPKPEPVNLSELTTEQRIKALYNQFNK